MTPEPLPTDQWTPSALSALPASASTTAMPAKEVPAAPNAAQTAIASVASIAASEGKLLFSNYFPFKIAEMSANL